MNKSVFASLLIAAANASLKIGVISDPHFNTAYSAYSSASNCVSKQFSGEILAPIGRYGCDPSEDMIDYMFTKFSDSFGAVDVILVPGDSVAHKIAASAVGDDPDYAHYEAVKANLVATFAKFKEYFPTTMILPTFGNNDGRYHDEAIDESLKQDYYSFVYDLWFNQLPGNANLPNRSEINSTLLAAGYYRADITPHVTLLSINSMYVDAEATETHDGEADIISNWFPYQLQLARAEGRKVLIMDHVYAGASGKNEVMWVEDANTQYFKNLRDYHDVVIMEVVGHEHYGDLRYHSSNNVAGLPDPAVKFDFHNILVSPGVTPYDGSNPGVTYFELDANLIPLGLRMEFLDLNTTLGKSSVLYEDLTWNTVDFANDWGLTQLDATSLATFRKRLEDNGEDYTNNYLVAKLGFNYNIPAEFT